MLIKKSWGIAFGGGPIALWDFSSMLLRKPIALLHMRPETCNPTVKTPEFLNPFPFFRTYKSKSASAPFPGAGALAARIRNPYPKPRTLNLGQGLCPALQVTKWVS